MLTSVKVSQVATVPAGVKLRLTDVQAQVRALRLKPVGKGLYETQDSVQFKVGEVLDLDMAGLPKSLRDHLEPLTATEALRDSAKVARSQAVA